MKILVTGRNGQVARALAERAAVTSNDSYIFVTRPEIDLEKLETIIPVLLVHRPDVIINAAAWTAVDQAEIEEDRAYIVNALAPAELAKAAHLFNAALIQISTDYVYDGLKLEYYVESDLTNPLNAYGRTKLEGEKRVFEKLERALVLRTSWVYSPFGKNFVKTMLSLAEKHEKIDVVDDQFGCPTSAFEIADVIIAIIAEWRKTPMTGAGKIFHFTGGTVTNWADFARKIFTISAADGGPATKVNGIASAAWPSKVKRPMNSRLSNLKIRENFRVPNFAFNTSLQFSIQRLLESRSVLP